MGSVSNTSLCTTFATQLTVPMTLPRFSGPTVSIHIANPTVHTIAVLIPCTIRAITSAAIVVPVKSKIVAPISVDRPKKRCLARRDSIGDNASNRREQNRRSSEDREECGCVGLHLRARNSNAILEEELDYRNNKRVQEEVGEEADRNRGEDEICIASPIKTRRLFGVVIFELGCI